VSGYHTRPPDTLLGEPKLDLPHVRMILAELTAWEVPLSALGHSAPNMDEGDACLVSRVISWCGPSRRRCSVSLSCQIRLARDNRESGCA
jgi:hypothetical protein